MNCVPILCPSDQSASPNYDHFSRSEITEIGLMLSNQTFKPPQYYGTYYFPWFKLWKSVSLGTIIGAAIGRFLVVVMMIYALFYAPHQKTRADRALKQNNPFSSCELSNSSGSIPQLKGARWFSFKELKKCTSDFSEASEIGPRGFGKVNHGYFFYF
ncbi:hypothetical protein NE237_003140 [Protea cynaroides]|uniref:Uncharacterized protein n=1 Tax=Protea cynaroides TaxID=273540 RepID=A0A9Q0KGU7_9MAGN|nr:hypothetical protein NE237_003140 [Protea cynaroides]